MKATGIALLVIGFVIYAAAGGGDEPASFFAFPFWIVGILLYFRGRQQAAKAVAEGSASPLRDSTPKVLYLRSFQSDPSTTMKKLFSGFTTEEEQLAQVLLPFGNMIAIGRPGESLPTPGATRMYATDAEWRHAVIDRMNSARLVVLRAGTSPGLFWEFRQAVSLLSPERVLVLLLNLTSSDYRLFADEVADSLQMVLPDVATNSPLRTMVDFRENPFNVTPGFICFSRGWVPEFLPLPFYKVRFANDMKKSFNEALHPVFDAHGVAWRPLGRI